MTSRQWWTRAGTLAACLALALWVGSLLQSVLTPLLLSALLAYLLNPIVSWLERRGFRRFRAILLLYAAGFLALLLCLLYAVPPLYRESARSARRLQELALEPSPAGALIEKVRQRAARVPRYEDARRFFSFFLNEPKRREDLQDRLVRGCSWLWERATAPLSAAFAFLSYALLAPLYVFYFLQKLPALYREIPPLIPPPIRPKTLEVLAKIDAAMRGFFFGRTLVCALKGAIVAAGLWCLDVPYAFWVGLLAALLSLLPVACLAVGGGLAVVLASADGASGGRLALVAGTFLAAEVVEGIANPIILGRTASLHPVMVVFAILAFGKLLGLFGLILAVPLASATKILWEEVAKPYVASTWGNR